MCGIVGYVGRQEAAPILLEGLKTLEYRGYDSAGVAVQKDGAIHMVKARGMIKNLCEKTHDGADLQGRIGIGHTRWATHGAPTDVNAHPHMSNDCKFAIVHNGIIENYLELREMLLAKGYVFHSETDTEVVVHLIDMYYDGNLKETLMRTTARLEGSYVLGVLCADEPDRLFVAKNGGPMILGVGAGENFFASDVTALVSHTKNVIYIDDGEFAELTADSLTVYDWTGKPVQKKISRVVWDIEAAEKGGYDHFMLKEIMEQPRALKATIEPRVKNDQVVFEELKLTDEQLRNVNKIIITACGSAYYAGQAGKYVLEKLTKLPVETDLASEFRYRDPIVDEHTLMIIISQSGETADTIAAMRDAKAKGARILAIVNVVGSTIAREAEDVLYTWAGPEIAVATTKAYSAQLSAIYLFALYMAQELKTIGKRDLKRYIGALLKLPEQVESVLERRSEIEAVAKKFYTKKDAYFLGRGEDYAAAMEGSLKLKEISYVHSEAYAAGELKHGTISLIEPKTFVVALATSRAHFDKMLSNVEEVITRGASVFALAEEGNDTIAKKADYVFYVPVTEDIFLPSLAVPPLQLLGYYVSKLKGYDVDKPRNLAKSVTVE